jgi:hypothetical protein
VDLQKAANAPVNSPKAWQQIKNFLEKLKWHGLKIRATFSLSNKAHSQRTRMGFVAYLE